VTRGKTKVPKTRLLVIKKCQDCPHMEKERTPGAGYAIDFVCTKVQPKRVAAGYIEWPSEEPKNGSIPTWCPLPKGKR
jgi:hypothetical protein